MNAEKLKPGLVVKNYKEMCNLLGEEVKNSNSKKSQMKEWERYFSYEKDKYSFVITDIYDKPKPLKDRRTENSIYTKLIELVLMYELSQKEKFVSYYTKTYLFNQLGMVNDLFLRQNSKEYELYKTLEDNEIPKWQFENFYARTQNKLTRLLFAALNSMKRRKLLEYYEKRAIIDLRDNNNYRIADENEEKEILRIERNMLKSIGCEKVPFKYHLRQKYYNKVSAELEKNLGWRSYREIKLIYNYDQIEYDIPQVKSEIMGAIKETKLDINDKVAIFLNQQAEARYKNNCIEYAEAKIKLNQPFIDEGWFANGNLFYEPKGFFKFPNDYIPTQKLLTDIFINI